MDSAESVEFDESSDIVNKNSEVLSENNENNEDRNISEAQMSCFLTASELFAIRENLFKSKSKDNDIYKGPKFYYPSDCTASEEIIEDIMQDNQKSLKLQRIAKNKDCLKAEWNEEHKVAIVPHLKGKTAQHIGITVDGKCFLSPEEALFLLEKGVIEVEHKKMFLSVEEAYSLMLKGKLAVEKYQVYTHLSQQGFIVVHHQSRIGPSYLKVMNLTKKRKRKRKAEESSDLPEEKRLTFSGVFTSNLSSVNAENNFSSDCLSNDASSVNEKLPSSDTLKKNLVNANEKMDVDLSNNDLLSSNFDGSDSHVSLNRETLSNNVISSNFAGIDSSHAPLNKETCFKEETKQDDHVKELDVSTKDSEGAVISSYTDVKDKEDKNEKAFEKTNEIDNNEIEINDNKNEFDVTNANKNIDIEGGNINEIDVENINKESVGNDNDDGDTNEVMIEDEQKSDINVEDSGSGYDDNEESESTDESIPIVYEDSNEGSLDVYSCSPSDHQSNKDLNIESNNLISKPIKDQDEEITLVRVLKKEKKPLAVIDLLSDEEDCDMLGQNAKKAQTETNGRRTFEDSDEEIEVLNEVSGTNNIKESSYRNSNFIKVESGKLKTESSDVKTAFNAQMKFPELYKAEMACITRPALDHIPIRCQPAKELYVLNIKKSVQPRSHRLWNSYRDMQEYQRERRREKQRNSFVPRTSCTYRNQNDTFSNVASPFFSSEYLRDNGVDRNHNYPIPTNKGFYQPMNSERGGLLPNPDSFSSPNRLPFSMNIHNFQNLSTSNPAAFVNEVQKTVYSVASNMISTILNQHLNPNNSHPTSSPTFNDSSFMNFNPHHNSFSSPRMPNQMAYDSSSRNDFPIRFPPDSVFSGERHSFSANENPFMMENVWRHSNNFRQRNYPPRGPSFPCMYRAVRRKKNWNDVKAAVVGTNSSGSGSDIEEVPINFNRFLYSNEIKPLVDPGTKLSVSDGLKSLKLTQVISLCDTKQNIDRYLPTAPTLEISFDVYLPNTKYKRSEPGVPNCRIVIVKASDPIPRYSELINLQRKWNDGAVLQVAVVDHGDISFYSFNSVNTQELVPFDSMYE